MANHAWRIGADVPASVQAEIIRRFPPVHRQVYVQTITWAYGVPADTDFPHEEMIAEIYGRHTTPRHEALLVRLGHRYLRADDRLLFLCLSTDGCPSSTAGDIDPANVVPIEELSFPIRLRRCMLRQLVPMENAAT